MQETVTGSLAHATESVRLLGGTLGMKQSLQKLNQVDRQRLWSERVSACRSSGQTVRQWCQENGIAEKTYYYWQRKIFKAAGATAEPTFAALIPPEAEHRTADAIAVIHAASVQVELLSRAEPSEIRAILQALTTC